jgi:hypothetical protein
VFEAYEAGGRLNVVLVPVSFKRPPGATPAQFAASVRETIAAEVTAALARAGLGC